MGCVSIMVEEHFFVRGESTKHAGFTEEAGYEAVLRMKEMGEFPEAIFCTNDTQAIGAFHGLTQLGMKIPDDIALMGYDNIKFTRYLDLSTVDQQMHKVGMLATKKLAEIIKHPDRPLEQTKIQPVLVKRNSTRKI
jgi:LacI family transcriptional regulator